MGSGPSGGLRVICTVRDVSEYKRLRNFSEGALQATEEERRRIARELHDDTAQRLATLILHVRRLVDERDAHARTRAPRADPRGDRRCRRGVKRMARGLRPPEIEELGLALAITAHVRSLREAGHFEVDDGPGTPSITPERDGKLALYRIVQEALSNARRYAGVAGARAPLPGGRNGVVAEIEDEGQGLPAVAGRRVGRGPRPGGHEGARRHGRRSAHDRERTGEGTTVRVTVPAVRRRDTMAERISVLLVDDHAMFRAGIKALIEAAGRVEVVGEASSGDEAVDKVRELKPDVVVMDLSMPGSNGLEATRRIAALELDTGARADRARRGGVPRPRRGGRRERIPDEDERRHRPARGDPRRGEGPGLPAAQGDHAAPQAVQGGARRARR
jgi:hypothetical protein